MSFWAEAIWIIRNLKKSLAESTEQIINKIEEGGVGGKSISLATAPDSTDVENPQEGVLYGFTDPEGGN